MARATTKADLMASANGQFDKLWKLIDSMSEELQKAAFAAEMTTARKETHWSTGTCVMCLYICTSGINCY